MAAVPIDRALSAVLLTVAYDGAPFAGWAMQPTARTVAGELLGAIRALDPSVPSLRGASRTDSGVHARGQLALFRPAIAIPPKGWALGLSAHLPREIAIVRAAEVSEDQELVGRIVKKRYRYLVLADARRDPFWEGRAWRLGRPFDEDLVRREAATLLGTHDFAAFRASADERTDTVRTILRVSVARLLDDPRVVSIDVEGTAFLYNMVRIIVGTLLEVGRGRLAPGTITRALASKNRSDLGITAPACGLYLEEVFHALRLGEVWP